MAIPKIYKYGIEITKPWSREMYSFNDDLKELMLNQINFAIQVIETKEEANKLAKIINPYIYGEGYDLENMKFDMSKNAGHFENHWLDEIWDDLITNDYVTPIFGENQESYGIIGFEKREEVLDLRKIYS
jgi:hypothetical protein|tara:strand:+ start:162 stop:551 length:390 start_codon:yes stop_codon:yes gene_type:complete